ncbi:hypothetical protein POVWA1_060410 [Plasmodium ovale wallikeri]|uniref:Uncharacterized protein n=1 Tax=Plasmodium ovale wallikeri TaxID=864142 RepID=A0A1A9A0E1_PLAOA|nr:hypothetical protein POVWA1_060410 [Plasmodium ovale wallikeri]
MKICKHTYVYAHTYREYQSRIPIVDTHREYPSWIPIVDTHRGYPSWIPIVDTHRAYISSSPFGTNIFTPFSPTLE